MIIRLWGKIVKQIAVIPPEGQKEMPTAFFLASRPGVRHSSDRAGLQCLNIPPCFRKGLHRLGPHRLRTGAVSQRRGRRGHQVYDVCDQQCER